MKKKETGYKVEYNYKATLLPLTVCVVVRKEKLHTNIIVCVTRLYDWTVRVDTKETREDWPMGHNALQVMRNNIIGPL